MKDADVLINVLIVPLILIILLIPLPAFELDILITVNIFFAFTILVAVLCSGETSCFYLHTNMFLISIIFSTALSFTVARSILSMGVEFDGRLIRFVTFLFTGSGKIVHLITGSGVFIAIIAIIVVVITKGVTRVTEIAARFSLDSKQVKLMTIELKSRSGEINEEETASQKAELQKKFDFYNALNGSAKFIFRNVICNLSLIVIIAIGGILIDILQNGKSFNEAALTYIPLAVGSGILFMLPSFLLSIAAGCLVTREVGK